MHSSQITPSFVGPCSKVFTWCALLKQNLGKTFSAVQCIRSELDGTPTTHAAGMRDLHRIITWKSPAKSWNPLYTDTLTPHNRHSYPNRDQGGKHTSITHTINAVSRHQCPGFRAMKLRSTSHRLLHNRTAPSEYNAEMDKENVIYKVY
jgi:hypothetical protein